MDDPEVAHFAYGAICEVQGVPLNKNARISRHGHFLAASDEPLTA
jgi:hypothetical protein